jgi:hypothetical protein
MFGFRSFYRGGKIFAAIPRTRGFDTPSSFMLKFDPMPASLFLQAQKEPGLNLSTRCIVVAHSGVRLRRAITLTAAHNGLKRDSF